MLLVLRLKPIMFLPFSSPRRTNASMKCSVECFKHIYTHPLVHVSTGDMHRMITVEGTRFVMALSFTAGRAPRSTAGHGAGALDPNLAPEGRDFPQECCCQQVCSLFQQTAPLGALPQLLASMLSWPRAAEAVLSAPGDSQPCCPLGTDIPWGCSGAGTVIQAKPYWSACRAACCGFRGGCSRCVDPSTSPGPANWDAAAARKSLELWALGVGARQSRALCQHRAQHSSCQMGSTGLLENSSDCLLMGAIFVTSCILWL